MDFLFDSYQTLSKSAVFEIAGVVVAVIFAILKQYHSRKRKIAEAEIQTKDTKLREYEISLVLKKRDLEELQTRYDQLKKFADEQHELRFKAEIRLQTLKENLQSYSIENYKDGV